MQVYITSIAHQHVFKIARINNRDMKKTTEYIHGAICREHDVHLNITL